MDDESEGLAKHRVSLRLPLKQRCRHVTPFVGPIGKLNYEKRLRASRALLLNLERQGFRRASCLRFRARLPSGSAGQSFLARPRGCLGRTKQLSFSTPGSFGSQTTSLPSPHCQARLCDPNSSGASLQPAVDLALTNRPVHSRFGSLCTAAHGGVRDNMSQFLFGVSECPTVPTLQASTPSRRAQHERTDFLEPLQIATRCFPRH